MKPLRRKPVVGLALSAIVLFGAGLTQPSGAADVNELQGSAYGAFVKVGLFGGNPSQVGAAPMVELPPTGGNASDSLPKLSAQFGPAVIFGGIWPDNAATGPASGPLTVKSEGKTGAGGFVTSSVDIGKHPTPIEVKCSEGFQPPCTAPGGIGPGPLVAEEVHSECRADESGLTGSVRYVKGKVETSIDIETQLANSHVDIPENPPPNMTVEGTLDHVGDSYRVVLNEQIIEGDVITVRAAHMYLLGPIAVGDSIVGQTICGLSGQKPSTFPPPTVPGRTSRTTLPDALPTGTTVPDRELSAQAAGSESDDDSKAPLVIGGVAAVGALALAGLFAAKRGRRQPELTGPADTPPVEPPPPDGGS